MAREEWRRVRICDGFEHNQLSLDVSSHKNASEIRASPYLEGLVAYTNVALYCLLNRAIFEI